MKIDFPLTSFPHGKETDLKKLVSNLEVTGIRFVLSAQNARLLCRLNSKGVKISKSLGTYAHSELEQHLPIIIEQVRTFHTRIAQGLHPFKETKSPKDITFAEFAQSTYMPNAMSRKKVIS